ncbi:MAG: type II secretion system protein [bacterium]|nr:type II secretion system protein [bacterium]
MKKGFTPTPKISRSHGFFGVSLRSRRGFTLIELMTAVSIFLLIMTVSMGSIVGVFDASRRSRSLKTVMSNLNMAIESMGKEMRYGRNYHCGQGNIASPRNCPSGDTLMSFLSSEDLQITYRLNDTAIEKKVGDEVYVAVTAPEIIIDELTFYTLGAGTDNTLQPKVLIIIKSHAGSGKSRTDFTLETLVSQRALDI